MTSSDRGQGTALNGSRPSVARSAGGSLQERPGRVTYHPPAMRREAGVLAAILGAALVRADRSARGRALAAGVAVPWSRSRAPARSSRFRHRREPRARARGRATRACSRLVGRPRRCCWRRLLAHDERVVSDGVDHYVYLRSLRVGHDLDLADDYAAVSPLGRSSARTRRSGGWATSTRSGPAILWAPFYLAGDLLSAALDPRAARATARSSGTRSRSRALLGLGGPGRALPAVRARRRTRARVDRDRGVAFGTFLWWYLTQAPTMAHAPEFAAAAGRARAVAASGRLGRARPRDRCGHRRRRARALVERAPRGPAPLGRDRARPRGRFRTLARDAGALGRGLPGRVRAAARRLEAPLRLVRDDPAGRRLRRGHPAWAGVLFSPHHGLFAWSPLLYLGLLGLALWARTAPGRALCVLAFVLALDAAQRGRRRLVREAPRSARGASTRLCRSSASASRSPRVPWRRSRGGGRCSSPPARSRSRSRWNLLLARAPPHRGTSRDRSRSSRWATASSPLGTAPRARRSALPGVALRMDAQRHPAARLGSAYMDRGFERWSVRMGEDDRLFLAGGWSEPRGTGRIARARSRATPRC
jgi:hypothetical protein